MHIWGMLYSGGVFMKKYFHILFFGWLWLVGVLFSLGSSYAYSNPGVHYENVRYSDNVTFYGVDDLNFHYSANLDRVGDSYELIFDVINDSGVDMMISECFYHEDDPYISYQLTYLDGKKVEEGDVLKKDTMKTLKYMVTYWLLKNFHRMNVYSFGFLFKN